MPPHRSSAGCCKHVLAMPLQISVSKRTYGLPRNEFACKGHPLVDFDSRPTPYKCSRRVLRGFEAVLVDLHCPDLGFKS